MSKRTKLKAGCGLASVFAVGAIFGALVLFVILVKVIPLSEGWRDKESKEFVLNHLASRLKLTEEQIETLRPIAFGVLDERYEQRKVYVNADIRIMEETFESMKEHLTDDQIEKGEKMLANWVKGKKRFLLGNTGGKDE